MSRSGRCTRIAVTLRPSSPCPQVQPADGTVAAAVAAPLVAMAGADEVDVQVPLLEAATSDKVASALASEKSLVLVLEAASEATMKLFEPAIFRGARLARRAVLRVQNPKQLRDRQKRSRV